MPTDAFASHADALTGPSRNSFAITPNDTLALAIIPKAIYVGTGGHIALRSVDGAADTVYRNVPGGAYLTVRASHIRATGTTASDIVGEA